jgi:hypothetical protein
MKLVLLIAAGVLILAVAGVSYYHYVWWGEHRFDQMIADAANEHDLDPALVKALIRVQSAFPPEANEDRYGLMLVTQSMLDNYRTEHMQRPWGYICVHRHFRNHDQSKPEEYLSFDIEKQPACLAPGCGQRLVPEQVDPETNLRVACWTLDRMRQLLRDDEPGLSPNEIEQRMLVAYRDGLPRGPFTMTAAQERFVTEVIRLQIQYDPSFKRRALRSAAKAAD